MKVKILSNFEYQTYPIVENMIEVEEQDLKQIGKTKQFDVVNQCIIDYIAPKEVEYKPTYEDLVEQKIRAKYSVNQELAVNRQRDTKPQEFKEYFDYCEKCKQDAKEEWKVQNEN